MSADPSIGMMDAAYFVGRREILNWVNDLLSLNLQKIEETCTGAVCCQLVDSIFPGEIPMHKVNWAAKSEYEYINNYKLLQSAFNRLHVTKHVEVDRLIRGRYQDNLENMQWFKRFVELHPSQDGYDAVAARSAGRGGRSAGGSRSSSNSGGSSSAARRPSRERAEAKSRRTRPANTEATEKENNSRQPLNNRRRAAAPAAAGRSAPRDSELARMNAELKVTVDGLERERDFYFGKLRDVEVMLLGEPDQNDPLVKRIFKVLYATEDGEEEETADSAQTESAAAAPAPEEEDDLPPAPVAAASEDDEPADVENSKTAEHEDPPAVPDDATF